MVGWVGVPDSLDSPGTLVSWVVEEQGSLPPKPHSSLGLALGYVGYVGLGPCCFHQGYRRLLAGTEDSY